MRPLLHLGCCTLFLSFSLREGFFILQEDAGKTPYLSLTEEPGATRWWLHLLLQHLLGPRIPSVRSTEYRVVGAPQLDFGGTGKVTGTSWKKANYLQNHLDPCESPEPHTCICSTTQWSFGQGAADTCRPDNPKPLAMNRSGDLLCCTISLFTKLMTHF